MTRTNFMPLGLLAGLVVLVVDQLSKWWILNGLDLPELRQVVLLPVLNLTMVWNRGVTFGLLNGLGSWGHVLLAVLALAVVVAPGGEQGGGGGDWSNRRRGDRQCHRSRALRRGGRFHPCTCRYAVGGLFVVRFQCC
jgi:hypothetical protein